MFKFGKKALEVVVQKEEFLEYSDQFTLGNIVYNKGKFYRVETYGLVEVAAPVPLPTEETNDD